MKIIIILIQENLSYLTILKKVVIYWARPQSMFYCTHFWQHFWWYLRCVPLVSYEISNNKHSSLYRMYTWLRLLFLALSFHFVYKLYCLILTVACSYLCHNCAGYVLSFFFSFFHYIDIRSIYSMILTHVHWSLVIYFVQILNCPIIFPALSSILIV